MLDTPWICGDGGQFGRWQGRARQSDDCLLFLPRPQSHLIEVKMQLSEFRTEIQARLADTSGGFWTTTNLNDWVFINRQKDVGNFIDILAPYLVAKRRV